MKTSKKLRRNIGRFVRRKKLHPQRFAVQLRHVLEDGHSIWVLNSVNGHFVAYQ